MKFKNHLEKFIDVNHEQLAFILPYFKRVEVPKKQNLMEAGQRCHSHYFVLEGCLRKFFIDDKGVEQTTEFAIENWWMTDHRAFENEESTDFYIQAVENSVVLTISYSSQEQLMVEMPIMERYFRKVYQRAFAALQMKLKYNFTYSKEEYFHHFNAHYPAFVQRVPQYLLASFLGLTPEYLSEIRNKKRS